MSDAEQDKSKNSQNSLYRDRPLSPSHRYKRYRHPSEEEHRTAEQHNWRNVNTLNVLIFMAAVTAAIFTGLAYCQSKRQADAAIDSLHEDRPWILPDIDQPVQRGLSFAISVNGKNIGKRPTAGLYAVSRVTRLEEWDISLDKQCKNAVTHAQDDPGFRQYSILTDQQDPFDGIVDISGSGNNEIPNSLVGISLGASYPRVIIGCIIYGSPFDNIFHKTGFKADLTTEGQVLKVGHVSIIKPD